MTNRRILITGASGFIGSHLLDRLIDDGQRVTCLYSERWISKEFPQRENCEYVFGDITDPTALQTALKDVDIVYHLAGRTTNQSGSMMRVNCDGTKNLLESCLGLAKKPVVIMVSSLAAVGPMQGDGPVVESEPPRPVSLYGRSKLEAEMFCHQYADRIPISILRPPIVFGPKDPNSFLLFEPIAQLGIHTIPGYCIPVCSLIHADDLVSAMIRVADSGKRIECCKNVDDKTEQGVYFVSHETNPKYTALGKMIGQVLGRERVFNLYVPYWTIRVAGYFGQLTGMIKGKLPYLNADKAKEVTAGSWVCNSDAIYRDTNFRPQFSLRERLRQTANWYFDNGWLKKRPRKRQEYSHQDQHDLAR